MAGRAAEGVLGLEDRVGDELGCVLVFESVEDALPVLPCRDDSSKAQLRKVLRHGCRALVHDIREIIDRKFTVTQRENEPDAGGIRKHRENLDRELDVLTVRRSPTDLLIRIHTQIIAQRESEQEIA